jgi:hypothetical protein
MDENTDIPGVSPPPCRLTKFEVELIEVCRHALLSLTNPSVESQQSAIQELMRVITMAHVKFGPPSLARETHWAD